MNPNDSAGQETSGQMAGIETHHIVCRDCEWEETASTSWAADTIAGRHRGETGHRVDSDQIE